MIYLSRSLILLVTPGQERAGRASFLGPHVVLLTICGIFLAISQAFDPKVQTLYFMVARVSLMTGNRNAYNYSVDVSAGMQTGSYAHTLS